MGFLGDLLNWGRSAWNGIFGAAQDVAGALTKLWHYITSVHNLLSWLTGVPVLETVTGLTGFAINVVKTMRVIIAALDRIPAWILAHLVLPWVRYLQKLITQLAAKEARDVRMLIQDDIEGLRLAEAYTDVQVTIERLARIKDVQAARAYALALTVALHQTIEREAASGYTEGWGRRLGLVGKIADEIATKNPVVKGAVGLLVKTALDLASVDDPLLRFALATLLTHVVNALGVDRVAGDLLTAILDPIIGRGKPANLHDVEHDVDERLYQLEAQWAEFMAHGGPEVEQAGDDWKDLTSLAVDAALLGFLGLAIADPRAAYRAISDTIVPVVDGTAAGVLNLLKRA